MSKSLDTTQFRITLEGGILFVSVRHPCDVGLNDARSAIEAERKLGAGKRLPTLVDMTGTLSIDREARRYFAGPETAAVQNATALIVSSPFTQAIGNFFLGLNKPAIPTRLFTNKSDAIAWLRLFVA
jgi:hypothetical protein